MTVGDQDGIEIGNKSSPVAQQVDAGLPCVDEQMKAGHAEYGTGKESVFGGNSLTSTEKADGWHLRMLEGLPWKAS
jgi:hypothetical protein